MGDDHDRTYQNFSRIEDISVIFDHRSVLTIYLDKRIETKRSFIQYLSITFYIMKSTHISISNKEALIQRWQRHLHGRAYISFQELMHLLRQRV